MNTTKLTGVIAFALATFLIACSTSNHSPANARVINAPGPGDTSAASLAGLRVLADVPLSGGTTRLDYQSLDSATGRLYIAHLGSDLMTVFDLNSQTVAGDVKDLKRVHGVLAVPQLHRVYASATGNQRIGDY